MKERPICKVENCNNEALLVFSGMYICGTCYLKLYKANQKQQLEQLNKICGNN